MSGHEPGHHRHGGRLYLHAIPYLQFPLLLAGRPFTGERAAVPGIDYPPEKKCFWTRHLRAIGRYYREHPAGPYSYGWWDSVPGRPAAHSDAPRWLTRYLPLVEEGTWAWLEIAESDLWAQPPADGVVALAVCQSRSLPGAGELRTSRGRSSYCRRVAPGG